MYTHHLSHVRACRACGTRLARGKRAPLAMWGGTHNHHNTATTNNNINNISIINNEINSNSVERRGQEWLVGEKLYKVAYLATSRSRSLTRTTFCLLLGEDPV